MAKTAGSTTLVIDDPLQARLMPVAYHSYHDDEGLVRSSGSEVRDKRPARLFGFGRNLLKKISEVCSSRTQERKKESNTRTKETCCECAVSINCYFLSFCLQVVFWSFSTLIISIHVTTASTAICLFSDIFHFLCLPLLCSPFSYSFILLTSCTWRLR